MRGTCSEGFRLVATGDVEQILPVPFADIADQTMLPVSHTLWAAVWTGIATDAVNRAKAFFRAQAQSKPGFMPPSGVRLAEAVGLLQMMQARLAVALDAARAARGWRSRSTARPRRASRAPGAPGGQAGDAPLSVTRSLAADMNTLKTSVSSTALLVVQETLMICGMAGYKERHRVQPRATSARSAFRAADDQQRPHCPEHRRACCWRSVPLFPGKTLT